MNEVMNANKMQNKVEEINILPILTELLRKAWLIALAAIIVGAASFTGSKFLIEPTYRASFTAYVNNRSQVNNSLDSLSNNDLTAAQQLVRAYSEMIHSRNVLSASAKSINLDVSYDDLSKMVTTQIQNETEIITVYVVDTSPEGAYELANAIASISPNLIADIIEGSSMKIIDMPHKPSDVYRPSYIKNSIIGALIGGVLAAAYFIIRFLMDDKVKNENDLEARFSLPVVGVIPDMNSVNRGGSHYYSYEYAYRSADSKKAGENNG